MRRIFSPSDCRAGALEMLPAAIALIPFGLVCGVAAGAAGASAAAMLALSGLVFSGASQVLAIELYAAGAPVAVAVLACLVIGLRLVLYSVALAPQLAPLPPRWRYGLAFLVTDQAFVASIRRLEDSADKRPGASYFLGCGLVLWVGWQLSNVAGYVARSTIPAHWQLDFAVPLCFIALVAPLFKSRPMIAAGATAAVGVVLLSGLPMRLNVILAGLAGIAAGVAAERAGARQ